VGSKYCYRDSERRCNDTCTAYTDEEKHGTHCLDLALQVEGMERSRHLSHASELNAVYMKVLSNTIKVFSENIKSIA